MSAVDELADRIVGMTRRRSAHVERFKVVQAAPRLVLDQIEGSLILEEGDPDFEIARRGGRQRARRHRASGRRRAGAVRHDVDLSTSSWAGSFARAARQPKRAACSRLEQWLLMMLHTARYAHPVFSDAFGVEDPSLGIGETRVAEMLDDWETQIREGALVHDRVAEVTEFEAAYDPTQGVLTIINFSVVTDDDETVTIADLQITTGAR
jgi:hypothetical protein